MKLKSACIAAALGLTAGSFAHAEVVVVVSAKSPAAALTKQQVSDIFLGKLSTFPEGGQVVPIDQVDGPVREEFHSKVTGKNGAQLKAFWSKQVFSGKGTPPKEVAAGDVRKLIADNPAMMGYLDKSGVDGSVKVVLTP